MRTISKTLAIVAGVMSLAGVAAIAAPASRTYATNGHSTTTCVDGSKQSNLSATWHAADKISVKTINNKQLCNDVTVFFSSYTMPDNYNGKGFTNNPTAVPQTVFASVSAVLKKGTTGTTTLTVDMPEACKNVQVDLYYAPEIKHVDKNGHGVQYITGKLFQKTVKDCAPVTPPEEPEKPVEPEVPVTPEVPQEEAQTPPEKPQVVVTPQPVELPKTGLGIAKPLAISAIVATVSYAVALAIAKRQ